MTQDPRHMAQDPRHMAQDPRHVTRDPRHMAKDPTGYASGSRRFFQDAPNVFIVFMSHTVSYSEWLNFAALKRCGGMIRIV